MSRTISVCLCLWLVGAQAVRAQLPADSLQRGRNFARWFMSGKADSLFAYAPAGATGFLASPQSVAERIEAIKALTGDAGPILEERFVWRNGSQQFWTTFKTSRAPEPFLLRFNMQRDGKIGGLGTGLVSNAPGIDSGGPPIKP